MTLRFVHPDDAEAILRIYAPYVEQTAATFETDVPKLSDFKSRIASISSQYPYLVCEQDGQIIGYAYATKHRERDAYRYDVDVSIYMKAAYHGNGAARSLYEKLFELLKAQGYYNAYAACVGSNVRSIAFHERCGFRVIGTHHNTGYKFGRWHDVVWMEREIRPHDECPGNIKPINGGNL